MGNVTAMKPRAAAEPVWLSIEQVCAHVPGMTPRRLEYLRGKGQGPRYAKPSPRTVVYALADVDAWVQAAMVQTRGAL